MFNKTLDTGGNPILSGEAAVCVCVCVFCVPLCLCERARHEFALCVPKRAALLRGQCVNQVLRGDWAPL